MSKITSQDIQKIANLSKLPLNEERVASYQKDLSGIIEYIAKIGELNTKDVPESHGGGSGANAFRIDEAHPSAQAMRDAIVTLFPGKEADMAKVPPVLSREK